MLDWEQIFLFLQRHSRLYADLTVINSSLRICCWRWYDWLDNLTCRVGNQVISSFPSSFAKATKEIRLLLD